MSSDAYGKLGTEKGEELPTSAIGRTWNTRPNIIFHSWCTHETDEGRDEHTISPSRYLQRSQTLNPHTLSCSSRPYTHLSASNHKPFLYRSPSFLALSPRCASRVLPVQNCEFPTLHNFACHVNSHGRKLYFNIPRSQVWRW